MVAGLTPLRDIACTYPDCAYSFDTISEMKQHKLDDPIHFYCRKCDIDCESWVDLTQHKVNTMAPFLNGRRKGNPKHIVCEFCGEEFRSLGGRAKHREQNHKADQHIVCPGCQSIFVRAALMVDHLERNQCSGITTYDFRVHIQEKYMIKELLQQPYSQTINYNLPALKSPPDDLLTDSFTASEQSIADSSDDSEIETPGGVTLLDSERSEHSRGRKLRRSAQVSKSATRISYTEKWPGLAKSEVRPVPSKTARVSYTEKWPSLANDFDAQAKMSQLSLTASETSSTIGAGKPSAHASLGSNVWHKGLPSQVKAPIAQSITQSAWKGHPGAANLFPDAKPTPADETTLRYLERKEAQQSSGSMLVNHKAWNLECADFNPAIFWNGAIGLYCCGYPACEQNGGFETSEDLKSHMLAAHTRTAFKCPACFRIFAKPSSLIAHAEAGGHCKIARWGVYSDLVNEITGGFLTASKKPDAALIRPGPSSTTDNLAKGVMTNKYKAALPKDMVVKW